MHERLTLGRLLKRRREGEAGASACSLFSVTVVLPGDAIERVLAQPKWLLELGLEVEPFGGATVVVRRAPSELEGAGLSAAAWGELLAELSELEPRGVEEGLKCLAAAAVPQHWRAPSHGEAHAQLQALDDIDFTVAPRRSRVVVHQVPLLELEACSS